MLVGMCGCQWHQEGSILPISKPQGLCFKIHGLLPLCKKSVSPQTHLADVNWASSHAFILAAEPRGLGHWHGFVLRGLLKAILVVRSTSVLAVSWYIYMIKAHRVRSAVSEPSGPSASLTSPRHQPWSIFTLE